FRDRPRQGIPDVPVGGAQHASRISPRRAHQVAQNGTFGRPRRCPSAGATVARFDRQTAIAVNGFKSRSRYADDHFDGHWLARRASRPSSGGTVRETAQERGVGGRRRWIGGVLLALGTLVIGASAITATAPVASSAPITGSRAGALGPSLTQARANSDAPLPAESRFRVASYKGTEAQGVANLQIPTWTHTQAYPAGNVFSYTMVGSDPFTAQANPAVTIQAPVVGLKLTFSDGTSTDASSADPSCTPSQSPVAATLNSPIFQTA